jgi:hypothetical protein
MAPLKRGTLVVTPKPTQVKSMVLGELNAPSSSGRISDIEPDLYMQSLGKVRDYQSGWESGFHLFLVRRDRV